MDKAYEAKYHSKEESNWWFISRRAAICKLLKNTEKSARILDVGCAGGPLLLDLQKEKFTNVYGLDFSPEAIELCKQRGLERVFVMDGHYPDFENDFFDIIISSDSLEHLEKDEVALANWKRILKPGGTLYVFVPAYQFLWSDHDLINHHYRRYSKHLLAERVSGAGFKIEQKGFWNFAMFFPTSVFRLIQRLFSSNKKDHKPKDQLESFSPAINSLLIAWMKFENLIFNSIGIPVGVSAFIKAKK
jgi:SAM-dependent methyltransferase